MASDITGLSVLNAGMKVIAEEPLFNDIVAESEFTDLFETDSNIQMDQTTGGRYIERAHIFGLPGGYGPRAEGDNMPEASDPQLANSRIYLRSSYGTIFMNGHTMRRVVNDEGSFVNWATQAFPLFAQYAAHQRDVIFLAYGAGIKARAAGTMQASGSDFTLAVDSAFGVAGWNDISTLFLKGERNVFSDTAAGTALRNAGNGQSAKVKTVIRNSNGTATLVYDGTSITNSLNSVVADNDYIFLGDEGGTTSQQSGVNRAPLGILAAVDDGNIVPSYLNVTRADTQEFRGQVIDLSSGTLGFGGVMSEDALNYADDETRIVGGGKVNMLVSSVNANRSYWKSLKQDSMFIGRQNMVGGRDNPMECLINGRLVPIRVVRKLPGETAYGLSTETFKLFTNQKYDWQNITGSIWNRRVTAGGIRDEYYAVGVQEEELACSAPAKNFRLEGITRVY